MEFDIGYSAAAIAGLLSFLSPCILPIVPFYLCYLAGMSFEALSDEDDLSPQARRRIFLSTILFALGVATVFFGLGASATYFGQALREWFGVLKYAAAAIILIMGLHFLGVLRIGLLFRQARLDPGEHGLGLAGAYLVGLAFAFGWTPCVGPVLASILFMAAGADSATEGGFLLLAYAAGMTLPFVIAGLFVGPFLRWAKGFRRHLGVIEKAMGALLIVFAVLIATDSINIIADWMLSIAPNIGTLQ